MYLPVYIILVSLTQVYVPRALSDQEKVDMYGKGGELEHLFSRSIWPSSIALAQTLIEDADLGK